MEFWGIEMKPGGPVKVHVEDEYTIHVSQVTLGESSKLKDETVPVYVKVGDGKSRFVIGNLSQKIPQVSLDLMIEQDFELSHNCKTSSVYLLGCKIFGEQDDEHNSDSDSDSDSEEEDIYMDNELANAPAPVSNDQKAIEAAESDSDEEDESDSDDEMDSDEDEDDGDDDDDSEEEVEEDKAPLKVEPPSKKQPNGGAMKQKAKHGPGCCVPPKAGRQ